MLDINKIVQDKITDMQESGKMQSFLEEKTEKLILDSISNAFGGWDIEKAIKAKVSESVSKVVEDLSFTAYNSFIAEKVKQLTELHLREDIAQKIQKTFEDIFLFKRESVKLSEIFNVYREWLVDSLDDSEKYELNNEWYAEIEEDQAYKWLTCSISKEVPTGHSSYSKRHDADFSFTIHRGYKEPEKGTLGSVYFEGKNMKDALVLKTYTNFEAFILNLAYNDTPIIIDIDNDYDIDTSLGLDI